jgi:MFS family permease
MQQNKHKIRAIGLFIWSIAATFLLYEFFLRTFVGSLAQQLIYDLHLNIEQFTFMSSAYYFAFSLMQLPVGILTDKFGVKKTLFFAILICTLATFLFAHSHNIHTALFSRILMGLGSSFAFVCLLVITSNWFPQRLFAFFIGASQLIGTIGPILAGGPLISTNSHIGWRVALRAIATFGIILATLTLCFVKDKPSKNRQTLLFLSKTEPVINKLKYLFKTKQAWMVAIYSSCSYVSIAVMAAVWGTDYLQTLGFAQSTAASMISIAWLSYAIGCPAFGFLSDLSQRRKPYLILCALLGLASMPIMLYAHITSRWAYEVLFAMLGLAATGQSIGFAAIAEHSSPNIKATALGLNNGLITMFAALLPLAIGTLISLASGSNDASHLSAHAFMVGLSLLPVTYCIALIVSVVFIQETYCKQQKSLLILNQPT